MAQDVRRNQDQGTPVRSFIANQPDSELVAWMLLEQVPGLGPVALATLQQRHQLSPPALFDLTPKELSGLGFKPAQIKALCAPDFQSIERALAWRAADSARHIICLGGPQYPPLLAQISRPPCVLYTIGDPGGLTAPQVAIVGSRHPTHYGSECAFSLAQQLGTLGLSVTSGLAVGIDSCAHRGALAAQGHTIAVMGCGLAHTYPKRNRSLASQICQHGGILVSEFVPWAPPKAEHFPRRNRIVSGLSQVVLIVEAALKSGSLITARYALEQNRDVMALPGNILNPLSAGCHFLIKQGAKLVTEVSDIVDEFQNVNSDVALKSHNYLQKSPDESLATDRLLDSVDLDVTALDVIIQRSQLPINEVLAQLLEYELRGLVAAESGGYIKLRGK